MRFNNITYSVADRKKHAMSIMKLCCICQKRCMEIPVVRDGRIKFSLEFHHYNRFRPFSREVQFNNKNCTTKRQNQREQNGKNRAPNGKNTGNASPTENAQYAFISKTPEFPVIQLGKDARITANPLSRNHACSSVQSPASSPPTNSRTIQSHSTFSGKRQGLKLTSPE